MKHLNSKAHETTKIHKENLPSSSDKHYSTMISKKSERNKLSFGITYDYISSMPRMAVSELMSQRLHVGQEIQGGLPHHFSFSFLKQGESVFYIHCNHAYI